MGTNLIREGVSDLRIFTHKNSLWYLHFGHVAVEGGYAAYIRGYRMKPTREAVNAYIGAMDSRYEFTEEEWNANTGKVIV